MLRGPLRFFLSMLRWRSMRNKVLLITLAVVTLPQIVVLFSSWFESGVGARMKERTLQCAAQTAAVLKRSQDGVDGSVSRLAAQWAVRIRVLNESGQTEIDHDHETHGGLYHYLGGIFFGPDGAPDLEAFDASLEPLHQRQEIIEAKNQAAANGCRHSPERKLLVCHAAVSLVTADGSSRIIYVQESSRRAIRALYDLRYQLLKLTLMVLPLGFALALWIGWRLVRPVEILRREVQRRALGAVPSGDIQLGRDDEIGDLATAFNTLLHTLQQRNRANEAFLADLAHEFKNPVAALRASAERLECSQTIDAQRAARLSAVMLKSCARLDALVTEFLELARAEAGLPNEDRSEVELGQLVLALLETHKQDERYRQVQFSAENAGQRLPVWAVSMRLESAVRNLLDNAASFARPQGRVLVKLRAQHKWAVFRVVDSGPGIASQDIDRVFERFFTTRGERQGTGLGLALTKAIIEAHGGTIEVRSPPGSGAEFTVQLPLKQDGCIS